MKGERGSLGDHRTRQIRANKSRDKCVESKSAGAHSTAQQRFVFLSFHCARAFTGKHSLRAFIVCVCVLLSHPLFGNWKRSHGNRKCISAPGECFFFCYVFRLCLDSFSITFCALCVFLIEKSLPFASPSRAGRDIRSFSR